jgi:hypothetical protein
MNGTIKTGDTAPAKQAREFSSDFLIVLSILTIATLILVFGKYEQTNWKSNSTIPNLMGLSAPWAKAGGQTISNGLAEFSGQEPAATTLGDRLTLFLSVVLSLVLGPVLFFFGWDARRAQQAASVPENFMRGPIVSMVLGGVLLCLWIIPLLVATPMQYIVSGSLQKSQAVQQERDCIINELNALAVDSRQFSILPRALGGGERSYSGYILPSSMKQTEHAVYTAEVSAGRIIFHAASVRYPHAAIDIESSPAQRMHHWTYHGEFQ